MNMNNREKYLAIVECLKGIVRAKGWTYKQLGDKVGLSEATVKRIFQGTPCNVDKLLQLCDVLEISFTDLVQLSSDKGPEKYYLTKEQDDFFAANLDHYAFFYAIYYGTEGTLKDLQRKWDISDEEAFLYLRQLEKLGLVEVHPDNHYRFKVSGQLNVIDDGAVIHSEFVASEFVDFTRSVADHRLDSGYFFRVAGLQLSHETYKRFAAELKSLTDRYYDKGAREEVLTPPAERDLYGLCIALGPFHPTEMKKFWDYGRDRKKKGKR